MPKEFNYYYLPQKYHSTHDYCEFVLSQIEKFITNKKFKALREQSFKLSKEDRKALNVYDGHILDFFESRGLTKELNLIVGNRILNSLLMETSYFLQEAFLCTIKMRLTVAFTLFRKPFSEILIIYMRLLLEKDFFRKFNVDESFDPTNLPNSIKKEYLESLNSILLKLYNAEDLYDYLFNKDFGGNIYNISNIATHLYTDRNPVIKTERQNLNFIFSQMEDIESQWEYIYTVIPMLLTFLADTIELCVNAYTDVPKYVFEKRFQARYKMRKKYDVK